VVPGSLGRAAGADRAGRARGTAAVGRRSQLPSKVQEEHLREQGTVGDDYENAPIALDEDTRRLSRLVREEEHRRQARLADQDSDDPPGNL